MMHSSGSNNNNLVVVEGNIFQLFLSHFDVFCFLCACCLVVLYFSLVFSWFYSFFFFGLLGKRMEAEMMDSLGSAV